MTAGIQRSVSGCVQPPCLRRWRTGFTRAELLLGEYAEEEGARESLQGQSRIPNRARKQPKRGQAVKIWTEGLHGTNYFLE